MNSEFLLIIIVNVLAIAAVGYFLVGQLKKATPANDEEQQRNILKSLVNEVFGEVAGKITEQSKRVLAGEKEIITTDLKNKQEQIEKIVGELRRELGQRQQELQRLEQDRSKQFSEITTRIREHQEITKDLQGATEKLKSVLSNNQTRGQWGEFILENILQQSGMIEGTHFVKQRHLIKELKPDITLLLPNERVIAVDVKFPYAAAQRMVDTESKAEREAAKKDFLRDVREKIKQVRAYVLPEHNTLDFALMFVPNEILFSYINQNFPEVIEEARDQHVFLVSPFTFSAVAGMVIENYRNLNVSKNLRKIIQFVEDFAEEWGRFEKDFSKFDDSIGRLRGSFDELATTRFKRMKMRIGRIEEYRKGMLVGAKGESQNLLPGPEDEV